MKRVFLFLLLFIATIISFGITVYIFSQNTGKGALQVTSSPTSKVYLDGKLIGTTPLCMGGENCNVKEMIKEGEHIIKLVPTQGSFSSFEQKIKISPKVLTVVDRVFKNTGGSATVISLEKNSDEKLAGLSLFSFPQNAKVFLDSSFQGDSPLLLKDVTGSDHEVKFLKEGYEDKLVRLKTIKGYTVEVQVFLATSPKTPVASSSASVTPQTSKVTILKTPTGFLNVRSQGSFSGSIISKVYPGETYEFLDEQNSWFKIKLADGKEGWISSQYASKD